MYETIIYFSFIHTYLNYGNLAWGSTHKAKLNETRFTHNLFER